MVTPAETAKARGVQGLEVDASGGDFVCSRSSRRLGSRSTASNLQKPAVRDVTSLDRAT